MSTEIQTTETKVVSSNQSGLVNQRAIFGGLSRMESAFVDYFMADPKGNQAKAAEKAGYKSDNMDALYVTASRLLRRPKIRLEIQRRLGNAVASSTEVLERLTTHARGDLTDVLNKNGELDLAHARRNGSSKLLKKMKKRTTYTKAGDTVVEHEYEIHDPQAALEKLGRFHKLFTDRVETEISEGDVDRITSGFIERLMELRTQQVGPTTDSGDEG